MKHTPRPWVIYDDSNDGKTNRIEIVAMGKTVARIYHSVPEEDLPNAHLIAAAPDLLEALESVWLWMENQADGQSKGGHATFDLMMLREQRDIVRAAIAKATGGAT